MGEKKLLIITSTFPYKSDSRVIFIKEQIKFLKNEFNQITVISPLAYFPSIFLKFKSFQNISGYFEYPEDYSYDNVRIFFPRYFPLPFSETFFVGIKVHLIQLGIMKIIKENNIEFDIIHSHFVFPPGYVGTKLRNVFKKPLVITGHGGDIYRKPIENKIIRTFVKDALRKSDKIITTSSRNRDIIISVFEIPGEKISIIGNGFDEKLFFPMNSLTIRKKLSLPENKKILLSVGNLIEIKGHKYLINAIKNAIRIREDLFLIILGRGNKDKLQSQIDALNLGNYVKIINGVPHDEIPFWINSCDIFVLPSLDEGAPTVISEALGCGKPVIASSVGGIPEIITNEELGILVEAKNTEDLANAIISAFSKKWDNEKISEYAKKNYSWEKITSKILDIYNNLDKQCNAL